MGGAAGNTEKKIKENIVMARTETQIKTLVNLERIKQYVSLRNETKKRADTKRKKKEI